MATRTLNAFDIKANWPSAWGASGKLVITHTRSVTSDGVSYPATSNDGASALRSVGFHWEAAITVSGGVGTTVALSGLINTDTAMPDHVDTYNVYIYDARGQKREKLNAKPYYIHESLNGGAATFTWEQWVVAMEFVQFRGQTTFVADDATVQAMIDAQTYEKAGVSPNYGITALSVAAASASDPIAVGTNDLRIAGTSGTTVSTSNRLVDSADNRLMSSLTYAALALLTAASGAVTGAVKFVTDQLRGLYYKSLSGIWASINGWANVLDFYASGDSTTTTTTGTNGAGTTINVTSATGYLANHGIFIAGAGAAGAPYVGTVVSVSGNAITVTPATSTSVAAGTLVQHDDTVAINAASAVCANRGGGTVWFPNGTYRTNGPFDATTNSILTFPIFTELSHVKRTVRWQGESHGFYVLAGEVAAVHGVFIDATQRSLLGSGTRPSVVAVKPFTVTTTSSDFSAINFEMDSIAIQVAPNPTISGINLNNASTHDLNNYTVWTGESGVTGTEPTTVDAAGVILSGDANDHQSFSRKGFIRGFYRGIEHTENARVENGSIFWCKIGIYSKASSMNPNIFDVTMSGCPTWRQAVGANTSYIHLTVERRASGTWFGATGADIIDGNFTVGYVYYDLADETLGIAPSVLALGTGWATLDVKSSYNLGNPLTVVSTTTTDVLDATSTALSWNEPAYDGEGYIAAANPTRITFQNPGKRTININIGWASNATGYRAIRVKQDGTTFLAGFADTRMAVNGTTTDARITFDVNPSVPAYIEIFVSNTSGAAPPGLALTGVRLEIVR